MVKERQSFSDAILQEPERFIAYAFKNNPKIKTFEEFNEAFRIEFDTPNGSNAKIDSDDIITLFESEACKTKVRENVNDKEYDSLYGDGVIVERQSISKKKIVTIVVPKQEVKSYNRKGKQIKNYTKGKSRKFSNAESKFIQVRKQKKVSTKQIIKEFDTHFKSNPRSASSIRTKVYRS